MNSIREIFAAWEARIASEPEKARSIATSFLFVLEGSATSSWLVSLKEPLGVRESSAEDGQADCKIKITSDDLIAIAQGSLNPQVAFLQGRIQLEGPMERALGLAFFFPK